MLVVAVGTVIEVHAEFSKTGGTYPPDSCPRKNRLVLADLAKSEVQDRLRRLWTDPARISAPVTREVSALLAQLAKSLEGSGINFKPNQVLALIYKSPIAPKIGAN